MLVPTLAIPSKELAIATTSSPSALLLACRREPVERVPVWFMRQAGRCLPEYQALRKDHTLLEICETPALAVEATLQPVRRLGVDAAILFSDIVVPLRAAGIELEVREGVGPVIAEPIADRAGVDRMRPLEPKSHTPYVLEAVAELDAQLDVPLIGFAGAPFTLACYLVEGGPSKDRARTKALMYSQPETWDALMSRLADNQLAFLRAQVEAGAAVVQLFDSWAGSLSAADYREFAAPYSLRVLEGLADLGAPRIHFGLNTSEMLADVGTGADVVGVDWRIGLDEARKRVGDEVALQGNLDPAVCLAPWYVVEQRALDVLERGGGRGHIFNLGHGVHPDTDPDTLARLVSLVHDWEIPR